jgi:hypothetical protein
LSLAAQPVARFLDQFCRFVIIFGKECSKFEQFKKRLEIDQADEIWQQPINGCGNII